MRSIEFRYWRVKNVRMTDDFWMGLRDDKPVHEENKKAKLSHMAECVASLVLRSPTRTTDELVRSYDAPVERPWTNRFYFDWIDPEDSPLSIAEFRFRSRSTSLSPFHATGFPAHFLCDLQSFSSWKVTSLVCFVPSSV